MKLMPGDKRPRRSSMKDERIYAPALEITTPGGEPMVFMLPQDSEALVAELVSAWTVSCWSELEIRSVVIKKNGEQPEVIG